MEAARHGLAPLADGLRVESLEKSFVREAGSPLKVLAGVTFTVPAGSITCVLGPSGCGKSTLLNIVSGLERADQGTVSYGGSSLRQARLGYVFQTPRLLPWRTVADNIAFALQGAGVPPSEWKARTQRYLELVGLADFAQEYPLYLSGGMQQRLGLARALAIEPELILMDEPFSSVDELTAVRLREEVRNLNITLGRTVMFVTHNVYEAAFLGDRVVLLSNRPTQVTATLRNPNAERFAWGQPEQFEFARELEQRVRGEKRHVPQDLG